MKFGILSIILVLAAVWGTGCGTTQTSPDKLQVVTTLFPQYDFVRQVGGDKVDVTLLLQPGVEAHSYDPTPADVVKMNQSDLIIYMGPYMETWTEDVFASLDSKGTILNLSEGFTLKALEEDHHHVYDPHLWTNLEYASEMVLTIGETLSQLDSEHAEYYQNNARNYSEEILKLAEEIKATIADGDINTLYFAGKFALYYFTEEFGLDYISAYDSCTSETEPSAKLVAEIVEAVKAEQAPVVFYEELSNHKAADTICQETGAKALLLHSCHNVSREEFKSGVTYVSLMKQNLEHLKEGLTIHE